MTLTDFLIKENIVSKNDADAVLAGANSGSLEATLEKLGVTPEELLDAKGKFYKIPTRAIGNGQVPFDILKYIPEESALHYHFVPVGVKDGFQGLEVNNVSNGKKYSRTCFMYAKSVSYCGTPLVISNKPQYTSPYP